MSFRTPRELTGVIIGLFVLADSRHYGCRCCEGTYYNLEPMNWFEEPRKLTHRSAKIWEQRKAELEELGRQGQNWALEELHHLRQTERVKNHMTYEQYKARRTPEGLRAKWREAKAAQRAA